MMNEAQAAYEASIMMGQIEDWTDDMRHRHGEEGQRACMRKLLDALSEAQED
jgi:hypothetical protein